MPSYINNHPQLALTQSHFQSHSQTLTPSQTFTHPQTETLPFAKYLSILQVGFDTGQVFDELNCLGLRSSQGTRDSIKLTLLSGNED